MYRKFGLRKYKLTLRRIFEVIRNRSIEGIEHRDSFAKMHKRRRLRAAIVSFQEYTLRKLTEQSTSKAIKTLKAKNLKILALASILKFSAKAKAIKGDSIQEKLLDSDAVIMDDYSNFVVVEHSSSIDFIPVEAL